MRTHFTASLGKITKKIARTMSPKTPLANLKKKRKGKNERERRKEGEKVKERKLALVALLVLYSCGFR